MSVVRVAVPLPLDQLFDYRLPDRPVPAPGVRVRVPLGRRSVVGVVTGPGPPPGPELELRDVSEVLDPEPVLDAHLLTFCRWLSRYYLHPLGEVFATALPGGLRRGDPARSPPGPRCWDLSAAGRAVPPESLSRAPRQQAVLAALGAGALAEPALRSTAGVDAAVLRRLQAKGWIETVAAPAARPGPPPPPVALNAGQRQAVARIGAQRGFGALLLDGVTGSGKTEVYLAALEPVLAAGGQALVLIPEISLTPQLRARFEGRFGSAVGVLHSGLGDAERLQVWERARRGRIQVVVGTRSALFTPLARPGLIIVDEEHDASFKQQDGLRYSARDGAVKRAQLLDVPVVLGSATPSLESLHNVELGRYQRLVLPVRAGGARMPGFEVLDLRHGKVVDGLAATALERLQRCVEAGEQALVFLNRRGYAPVLSCAACGWVGQCDRCDARLVLHRRDGRLRCHHCGRELPAPSLCPACGSSRLEPLGEGTQRLEEGLRERFPGIRLLRIDRDSTRSPRRLEAAVAEVRAGGPLILLGTQMLAKGHDFPGVTLAVVANLDQALFSSDFRAPERAAQLLVQVAGRAGRGARRGQLLLQTRHPEHPLFQEVLGAGYGSFARSLLAERRTAGLPPCGQLALLRAESLRPELPPRFLGAALRAFEPRPGIELYGPMPCAMERRAGRYRHQLVVQGSGRGELQDSLRHWLRRIRGLPLARRVRWSLDVDPIDHV